MNTTCYVYITTRKPKDADLDILSVHRRLEYARKELDKIEDTAKAGGHRCVRTQAACCLRTQKGDTVTYYQITKRELK
ncbi:MAG: hypothetical protein K6A62_04545 [Bacteroidales bacterium]|nr:hypothetical protein [Bacteroidales bacterium]